MRLFLLMVVALALLGAGARPVSLAWDYEGNPTNIVFEVWSTPNLTNWSRVAVVTNKIYSANTSKPQQFYMVRASNTVSHLVSEWNH